MEAGYSLPVLPLLVIAGPTGSGKTSLALRIASEFHGEIVNCDSLQLYQGFNIGTAKTPPENRQGIPHHLFDVLSPEIGYSAGEYARAARKVLEEISARKQLPVVAGGTGFYLGALLRGLPALPAKDEAVRRRLILREERRPGSLHKILLRLDPGSARRIHSNDVQKLIRAVELRLLTSKPRPPQDVAGALVGYRVLVLGLDPDREELARRLECRAREMFHSGLIDEVRGLLKQGCSGKEKPFEALGYRQALQVLRGECSVEQAIESTVIATRQYAKRQRTWFRREPDIHWIHGFGDEDASQQIASKMIRDWIAC